MARFCTLYSGSSGNSTYIGTGTGGILAGRRVISCKALLRTALSARDIRPDTIRGLFLTHEHIDHIKGVRVLLKKYAIPLFCLPGELWNGWQTGANCRPPGRCRRSPLPR